MSAAAKVDEGPVRQCAVTRRREQQGMLLRLALGPDGLPCVDVLGRAPGRGVYVAPEELRNVLSPRGLAKTFRGEARQLTPAEVDELVEATRQRLEERLLEILGIARRAGSVALGMDASLAELARRREEVVVLTATDLAPRSLARVREALSAVPAATWIQGSTVEAIGAALGRGVVGVAAVWHPKLRDALQREAGRLSALKAGDAATRKND